MMIIDVATDTDNHNDNTVCVCPSDTYSVIIHPSFFILHYFTS